MSCFRTCHKTNNLHFPKTTTICFNNRRDFSIHSRKVPVSLTPRLAPGKKRYESRKKRHRWIRQFEMMDQPPNNEIVLNEHGEYETPYGDWLHNARETVYVRDRHIWEEEFRKLRKKYKQEYSEKFRQRLAEFTRISDAKMYDLNLQAAQFRERKRLRNIRINALKSANDATKARRRMQVKRMNDIIHYDLKDSKREAIREMIWEKPSQNWIIKENFNNKLNIQLMNDLFGSDDGIPSIDEDYISTMYPGLPENGYYDTMEGLFRHSDKYFTDNININECINDEQQVTTITRQPISWYIRKSDGKDEFVEEIYASQMALNKHLKRYTHNNRKRDEWLGKNVVKGQGDIEYEVDEKNIVPNYFFNIDWNREFEKRNEFENMLDRSPIFIGNKLICEYELNKYEDLRLLLNIKYYKLLKECKNMNKNEIKTELKNIFVKLIPNEIINKYENVENCEEFLDIIIDDIIGDYNVEMEQKWFDEKRWSLYFEFNKKMKHFSGIYWQSAKINFDSEIRKWRSDFLKWRYLIFENNKEHIEWRHRLRKMELTNYDLNLCKKAIMRFQQLEHLILARRTGPNMLEKLINDIESEVLKVFYIWLEELVENGEEICMGRGWSFNRYEEQEMLPAIKAKQIPIEYFKLPVKDVNVNEENTDTTQQKQFHMYKSH